MFQAFQIFCGVKNPQAARHTLKKTGVPSLLPWASVDKERTTTISQKAALELECDNPFLRRTVLSLNEFCEMDAENHYFGLQIPRKTMT